MEASNRSLVHVYCTVALTSYFLELFFLLPQFMYVLISPGALTQCIMSISAKLKDIMLNGAAMLFY